LSLKQLDVFMAYAKNDLTTYAWPFIETIATKDFDADAEESIAGVEPQTRCLAKLNMVPAEVLERLQAMYGQHTVDPDFEHSLGLP
jgi:hypothetical protein